jgi:predicted dehydrogenase
MKENRTGIIMNGVTGRMGTNQHLMRSIVEIIKQGGVKLGERETIIPDPVLVGRNEAKLKKLAGMSGVSRYTTNLEEALSDKHNKIYFDAQTTGLRYDAVKRAINAGLHIYCEKPAAVNAAQALELYGLCLQHKLKSGVVQDKLWLPGILKLKKLIDNHFFGRIISVRGEFGYWVFEGHSIPAQRPSWNYRKEDDGGIIMDMLCHWQYLLENLFGKIKSVSCLGATHIPERVDENGQTYQCTAEDAAYSTFILDGGIIAHFNSSWVTRVRRDDLLTVHVDGTLGSAVAGLRKCFMQTYENTPRPVWNPDVEQPIRFLENWIEIGAREEYDNAFKAQWELFLKHIAADEPFPWNLMSGARGVQLAEKGLESWEQRRWIDIPDLDHTD